MSVFDSLVSGYEAPKNQAWHLYMFSYFFLGDVTHKEFYFKYSTHVFGKLAISRDDQTHDHNDIRATNVSIAKDFLSDVL